MKAKIGDILTLFALLGTIAAMIIFEGEVSEAVRQSLEACAYSIVPSLFAVMVLSTAISKSGAVGRIFSGKRLNADVFTAFFLGNIGGYPVGAKLLSEAVSDGRLTKDEAAKASGFCYGAGPAFAAGIAGTAVFGDARFGLFALLANILANVTLYGVYLLKNKVTTKKSYETRGGFSSSVMVESVASATSAMITVCSMIVFFAAIRAVLQMLFPSLLSNEFFPALLEISNISRLGSCKGISLAIVAMLLSFGGLCVNLQVVSIIGGRFSVKQFFFTRIFAILLSGIYALGIERLTTAMGWVREASTKIRLSRSPSLIPIICVAAMVFITLSYSRKERF